MGTHEQPDVGAEHNVVLPPLSITQARATQNSLQVTPGLEDLLRRLAGNKSGGSGTWTQNGPFEGLRFDLPWVGSSGNVVQLDWARLTPNTGQM